MVVITGLSGSGKSTLAFDILFAEGQRRYLDSMSPYARQFVEQLEKPDVDLVEGCRRAWRLTARYPRRWQINRRDRHRGLSFSPAPFAKAGTQFCPECDLPVEKQSVAAIVKQVETAAKRGTSGCSRHSSKPEKVSTPMWRAGLSARVSTRFTSMARSSRSEFRKLERFKEHTIDVVVGVIDARRILKARSLTQRAFEIGRGTAHCSTEKAADRREH